MTRNIWDNQDKWNPQGCFEVNSLPIILDKKGKNAGMEVNDNRKGSAWATNYQRVSKSMKSGGRSIEKTIKGDEVKIG